jgi:cellulose synthase (UDP-forming)
LIWALRASVLAGVGATWYYLSWWMTAEPVISPPLLILLLFAAAFHWSQLLSAWILYLAAGSRPAVSASDNSTGLSVDVYVAACGEPVSLVERTLSAAIAMRGEHSTWLLDDASDPELRALAKRLGAGYLTRAGQADAKAGNVNAALPRTDGDIIAILDVDHVPEPEFLERSLGWFENPRVGFVQVMLSFRNAATSWIAKAAAETARDFYNVTCLGMARLGGATLIGSNALIRRRALASIGGYRPGLAEDLATSIALHARGWESRYVAEPLAPGLSPIDLQGWFRQQAKWARGVFEVLLTDYARLFRRLTWAQRLCYLVRMTYYWIGPVVGVHLVATLLVLLGPETLLKLDFRGYLLHAWPLLLCDQLIRRLALLAHRHPTVPGAYTWRGYALTYSTWFIYCAEWLLAVSRRPVSFKETPKQRCRTSAASVTPQVLSVFLLALAAVAGFLGDRSGGAVAASFALFQMLPVVVVLVLGVWADGWTRDVTPDEQRYPPDVGVRQRSM